METRHNSGGRTLPPFAPPKNVVPVTLPPPAGYRALRPLPLEPLATPKVRRFERKKVVIGVCIAVVLHVSLVVGWWLSPPLRLKAGYSPDRWVTVLSIPPTVPTTPPAPPAPAALPTTATPDAAPARPSSPASRAARKASAPSKTDVFMVAPPGAASPPPQPR